VIVRERFAFFGDGKVFDAIRPYVRILGFFK
jgi:hypothetical protein